MKLLAVDTATEACSAALYIDGEILERFELAPRTHTQLILPMIDSLMAEAELAPQNLDGLAFGRGPGSFTGVRIATGVIQGIALGLDLPVVPVSTLAALAQNYFEHADQCVVFACMDARMGEVFWGAYRKSDQGFAELLGSESVGSAENVDFPEMKGYGIGSGWKTYREALGERLNPWLAGVDDTPLPKASAIALLGARSFNLNQAVPVEQAMPVYLRDKVAKNESGR